jgi:acetyl-CoA carboxylase biotin carboxylase subunit
MFQKILIANRGEIAVRVIRACRDLEIDSVAVYSEADRGALHVRLSDEAWPCGPPRAQDSYLATDTLLDIALRSGADAVHPGYGFLSENGDFADACESRGLTFIGPSSKVLREMGDKVTSRRIMRAAGVSVVPGSEGALSDDEAVAFALEIGLPVLIKASGGGGGRGMRVVRDEKDLRPAIERARSEALASFSNDAIYVEKLVEQPRHIEVQVLADRHGHAVHLFERECSIQRRHQKLLEEAPACGIDTTTREALGAMALSAATAVDYVGAGTVEFLLGADGAFHFLEMNTRIQVEHPITEAITRLDLVKEMIRVAAGEPLSFRQDEISLEGHALEARIYAEDPAKGFLPSPGRIDVFRTPDGPGVRVDAGVQAGDTVTPHYDAMLAKLVVWGATRAEAIRRLDRALGEFAVAGIRTSIPFHQQTLRHPDFLEGRYTTGFVESMLAAGDAPAGNAASEIRPDGEDLLSLAAAVAAIAVCKGVGEGVVLKQKGKGARKEEIPVRLTGAAPDFTVDVAGESMALDAIPAPGGAWSLRVEGRQREAFVTRKKTDRLEVWFGGLGYVFELVRDAGGPT